MPVPIPLVEPVTIATLPFYLSILKTSLSFLLYSIIEHAQIKYNRIYKNLQ